MNNDEMAKQIADAVIQNDMQEQREGEVTLFLSVAMTFPNLGIVPESPVDMELTAKVNAYITQYNESKVGSRGL